MNQLEKIVLESCWSLQSSMIQAHTHFDAKYTLKFSSNAGHGIRPAFAVHFPW